VALKLFKKVFGKTGLLLLGANGKDGKDEQEFLFHHQSVVCALRMLLLLEALACYKGHS
jgi:hypothetical protein